jgi:protein SCO1
VVKAPAADGKAALEARISALVARPLFWILLIFSVLVFPVARSLTRPLPKPPGMRLPVAAFELVNQRGQRFGSQDLAGKVYVADFIFTSCGGPCPRLTKTMERIQKRTKNLGTSFQLVTITVDPENDTPEKLAAYARGYHVNPTRWSFLTGPQADVERTVVKGFKLAMGKEAEGMGMFHSERLVLVDGDGNIRGLYENDDDGIASLIRDADVLLNLRDWGPQALAGAPKGAPVAN